MHLVPIPTTEEHLRKTLPLWLPFLEGISRRSREPVRSLLDLVARHEVQVVLVCDDDDKPVALAGVRRCLRGDDPIGEIVWLTGKGRETWQHLLPELERFLKDTGCVVCRPVCRPGWSRFLKQNGYKTTHIIMEKKL